MAKDGWLGQSEHSYGDAGDRLQALCSSCVTDAGVDGAGLAILARDGTPETVYATDEVAARVEDLQFTLGEGPCVDAARSGTAVLMPRLATGQGHRWPTFEREASTAGVEAVFAFPIRMGATLLGTLDLHRSTPGDLSQRQLGAALATVDSAAWLLLSLSSGGLDGAGEETTYRMLVHQAAGMAMMQLDSTIDEALLRLRAIAYAEGRPINDLAADIVSTRRRLSKEAE
jgi:hypothetical protein